MKFADVAENFMEQLRSAGKKPSTIYTYSKDIEVILTFFGKDNDIAKLTPGRIGMFLKSETLSHVTDPYGHVKPRARRTLAKILRVLRQYVEFSINQGYIAKDPLPANYPRPKNPSVRKGHNPAFALAATTTGEAGTGGSN